MALLVLGGTGTLGSQIVKHALNNGYEVRCLVRNLKKSRFLRDWGAELIKADLVESESISEALKGIKYIIDASTSRLNDLDSLERVDFQGKKNLLLMSKAARIKHFIFYSFPNVEDYPFIPLIEAKLEVEKTLKTVGLSYTIFKLPGFYQGLVGQYGIPILENNVILSTNENNSIPYIDAEDIAKISIKSLLLKTTRQETFGITGPKNWKSNNIIELCENLSGQTAQIRNFPIISIILVKNIACFFEWLWPIANRLLFIEVLTKVFPSASNRETFKTVFKINSDDMLSLENFLKDYFQKILKDLKQINFNKSKNILF